MNGKKLEYEGIVYNVLKKYGIYKNLEDYIDIGWIGQVKALNTYDKSRGKITTHIQSCVQNELKNCFAKESRIKRKGNMQFDYGDTDYIDTIPDKLNIENDIIEREENDDLYKAIEKLNKREKYIILNSFKLNGNNKQMKEVYKELNISKSRGCIIRREALNKLKKLLSTKIV